MRKLPYLIAVAAFSGAALAAGPTSANPISSGLAKHSGMLPEFSDGLIQKVHGRHCSRKRGWYKGKRRWHRHWSACRHRPHPYSFYRPYPHIYSSPAPGFYYDEWEWERRNWLWD